MISKSLDALVGQISAPFASNMLRTKCHNLQMVSSGFQRITWINESVSSSPPNSRMRFPFQYTCYPVPLLSVTHGDQAHRSRLARRRFTNPHLRNGFSCARTPTRYSLPQGQSVLNPAEYQCTHVRTASERCLYSEPWLRRDRLRGEIAKLQQMLVICGVL